MILSSTESRILKIRPHFRLQIQFSTTFILCKYAIFLLLRVLIYNINMIFHRRKVILHFKSLSEFSKSAFQFFFFAEIKKKIIWISQIQGPMSLNLSKKYAQVNIPFFLFYPYSKFNQKYGQYCSTPTTELIVTIFHGRHPTQDSSKRKFPN